MLFRRKNHLMCTLSFTTKMLGMVNWIFALSICVFAASDAGAKHLTVEPWMDRDPNYVFKPKFPLTSDNVDCFPKMLHPGDALTVNFLGKHGTEAIIVQPNGNTPYVAEAGFDSRSPQTEIQHGNLARMSSVTFDVDSLFGSVDYEHPRVRVFAKRGVYMFEVSDKLDIDDPIIDGFCKVLFDPRPRPRPDRRRLQ